MNIIQIRHLCRYNDICGNIKKFSLLERIILFPDKEHFCGEAKGHKGKHKCFYVGCKKEWRKKK